MTGFCLRWLAFWGTAIAINLGVWLVTRHPLWLVSVGYALAQLSNTAIDLVDARRSAGSRDPG